MTVIITQSPMEQKPLGESQRVAIIGAGVSGVVAAKYLKASGFEVVVYERAKAAGGNWYVNL